eukprot:TRINITY_DN6517_c1_g1_i1.p1 TRINITY_DN6517_c1_g1~~TRINITY_DN6517_c1_g1_i1.p1  ORF type:complete len:314 (+),score=67.12 TRINITY_DN6517_c1_g1_i1:75-1016(+)
MEHKEPVSYVDLVLGLLAGLFESFHKGNFSEWAKANLTEDFLLTQGAKMNDRSEERSCIGRDFLALFYNNVLHRVWKGPTSKITWEPLCTEEITPGVVKLVIKERVVGDGGAWTEERESLYIVNINKELHVPISLLILPAKEEDEMSENILIARDCIPTHADVKTWIESHKTGTHQGPVFRPLAPPTTDKPCDHNNWDSVRVKRKWCLLRCRTCCSQWRIKATDVERCPNFSQGTCVPSSCTKLHIHLRKQRFLQESLPTEVVEPQPVVEEQPRVERPPIARSHIHTAGPYDRSASSPPAGFHRRSRPVSCAS